MIRSCTDGNDHTPGPWRVEVGKDNLNGSTDDPVYGGIYGGVTRDDSMGWAIARVWSDYPNYEADARLIAAAPDLLDACERAERLFDSEPLSFSAEHISELAAIREALRKAKG